jgi:hypothetical protein
MSTRADQEQVVFVGIWSGLALFWIGVALLVFWSLT